MDVRDNGLLRQSYPAVASSIPAARQSVCDFASSVGAGPEQVQAIRLAVSEALTNVVQFAYPWRTGQIHITGRLADGELWILIADTGCGIHAGRESDGLGLGLALISHVTDGFSVVERSSGGTELRLCFKVAAPDRGASELSPAAGAYERGSVASATLPASPRFSTTT
jgi:anti-sigma regulatory factor (Ser/Thr protein kinase)